MTLDILHQAFCCFLRHFHLGRAHSRREVEGKWNGMECAPIVQESGSYRTIDEHQWEARTFMLISTQHVP